MTGSSVAYVLNKQSCAVIPLTHIFKFLSLTTEWLNLPVSKTTPVSGSINFLCDSSDGKKNPILFPKSPKFGHLQMHRCVAIVPTLPFLHAAPNDLKALEINKAPIPGGD